MDILVFIHVVIPTKCTTVSYTWRL